MTFQTLSRILSVMIFFVLRGQYHQMLSDSIKEYHHRDGEGSAIML
jgi:hypothetical protein